MKRVFWTACNTTWWWDFTSKNFSQSSISSSIGGTGSAWFFSNLLYRDFSPTFSNEAFKAIVSVMNIVLVMGNVEIRHLILHLWIPTPSGSNKSCVSEIPYCVLFTSSNICRSRDFANRNQWFYVINFYWKFKSLCGIIFVEGILRLLANIGGLLSKKKEYSCSIFSNK